MSKDKTQDDNEVGYGKPPKNTQFQKGVSGNPKGRPKKCRNFYEILIRESESLMPITENGKRKRLSKDEVAIKQLLSQVIRRKSSAQRMYFPLLQQALERTVLVPGKNKKAGDYTEEELIRIIDAGQKKE